MSGTKSILIAAVLLLGVGAALIRNHSLSRSDSSAVAGTSPAGKSIIPSQLKTLTPPSDGMSVGAQSIVRTTIETNALDTDALEAWAEQSVDVAGSWAAQVSDPQVRRSALQVIAVMAAEKDLATATNWMSVLHDEADRQTVLQSVAYEASRTDPIRALDLASELVPGEDRDELLSQAARQWGSTDPDSAFAWIKQLPDADLRNRLLAAVVVADAKTDGAGAADRVSRQIPIGEDQTRAAVQVVQRWGQSAPEETAAWVEQFPVGATRQTASDNLVAIWRLQNPAAAEQWLATKPGNRSNPN